MAVSGAAGHTFCIAASPFSIIAARMLHKQRNGRQPTSFLCKKRKQQQKQVVAAFGSEPDPGLGLRLVGSSERPSCLLILGFEARLAKSQASLIPWQVSQGLLHIKAAGLWGIWRLPLQVSEEYKRHEGPKPALKGNFNT